MGSETVRSAMIAGTAMTPDQPHVDYDDLDVGKGYAEDGTVASTWTIEPDDDILLAVRKAHGKSAPAV
ncbi:MAG: hypothetical protein ACXVDS_09120 [Actinomycetota bacterium]